MLTWLGYINFGLAAFNLVPGYPLDGGRVLRSLLWWKSGDADRATHKAAVTGQVVGGLFVALGIIQFFFGLNVGGLWIAFIGWFLLSAGASEEAGSAVRTVLRAVPVSAAMTTPVVDGTIKLKPTSAASAPVAVARPILCITRFIAPSRRTLPGTSGAA